MVDYSSRDSPYILEDKPRDEYSPNITNILRNLKAEIGSRKENNDKIIQSLERLDRE